MISSPLNQKVKSLFVTPDGNVSRRGLLLGASGVALAGIAGTGALFPSSTISTVAGEVNSGAAEPIGDDFFLVDGWVLSAQDLHRQSSN